MSQEFETKFWKALESDRIMMLGVDGVEDGFARPMAAQIDGHHSPIWFFTSSDNHLMDALAEGRRAVATFTSSGHDLYASVQGSLTVSQDRSMIDRLWNPQAAAWFEGGKDDPKIRLLRLDAKAAEIWLDSSNLLAGVKSLLGADPKKDAERNHGTVTL